MTTDTDPQPRPAFDGLAESPSTTVHDERERLVAALVDAVRGSAGSAPPATREMAFAVVREGAIAGAPPPACDQLEGAARALVEAVAERAHDVPAEMVERALTAGRNEHEVFDLIVVAAVGAGLSRREIGLEAIDRCRAAVAASGGLP